MPVAFETILHEFLDRLDTIAEANDGVGRDDLKSDHGNASWLYLGPWDNIW